MLKPSVLSSLRKSLANHLAHQTKVSRRLQRAVKPVLESLEGRIQFSFTVTGAWQGLSTTENGFASGDVSHKYFGLWSTNPPDASQAQVVPDLTVAYLQGTVYSDDFGQTTYPSTLSEDSVALDPLHSQYQSDYTATGFVNQKVELFTKIDDPDLYSFFADSGSTWLGWKVNYVKETCNNSSGGPVRYNDGTAKMAFDSDFLPHADGTASTVSRSWSNGSNLNGLQPISFGNGMDLDAMPAMQRLSFIAPHSSEPGYNNDYSDRLEAYGVALSSTKTFLIMKGADGGWRSNDQQLCRKIERTSNGFKITDAQGEVLLFADSGSSWSSNQKGKLVSRTSPTGDTQSITWDSTGTLPTQIDQTYIVRSGTSSTTASDSFLFSYQTGTNQVTSITQKRNGVTVRRVGYEYYDSTDSNTADDVNGRTGDLKYVTKYDVLGTTETIVGKDYYRWYTTTTDGITQYGGYAGGLKAFLGNDSQQKALHSLGVSSLDSVSDASLVNYSDNFFQYDTRGASGKTVTGVPRVSKEVTSGTGAGCSCGKTGEGAYTFDYQSSSNPAGVNSWSAKTTETLPDGSQNIVYTNSLGDIVLKVVNDTTATKQYMTWYRYNKDGNVILQAEGKAITGIDEALPDLVGYGLTGTSTKLSDTGRIDVTNYFDAADTSDQSKFDYVKSVGYQVGQTGPVVLTESWEYVDNGVVGDGIWNVATDTTYPSEANQTVRRITSYSYDSFWQSGSANTSQPKVVTTSYAQVSGAQNGADSTTGGSSGNYQAKTYYDSTGRVVWYVDGNGYISYLEYDPLTGEKTKQIDDVNPSSITSQPVDGPARANGLPTALNLKTEIVNDDHGRKTKVTDPNGNVTFWVYDDTTLDGTPRRVLIYTGWNAATHQPTGPVYATIDDPATGIKDTLTYTWTGSGGLPVDSGGVPTGAEDFSSGNYHLQSLVRELRNVSGQVVEMREYTDFTGLNYVPDNTSSAWVTLGVLGTNYLSTKYKYDAGGRLFQTTTPDGTVTRTIYDARGLAQSVWKGVAIGTDYDAANTRVKVAEFTYDDNGNQLTSTSFADSSTGYTTTYEYDARDRLTDARASDKIATKYAYNNLGEQTQAKRYADTDTDFVIDSGELMTTTDSAFDDQGRVYHTELTSGGQTLASDTWYDKNGNVAKQSTGGQGTTKYAFDGAGRLTVSYITESSGDSSYTDALNVSGDRVYEQAETTYDAAGNVILTANRQRFHDAAATEALGNPSSTGTTPKARVYYTAAYYDAANRLTASVDVGTNNGSAYTRPSVLPTRSDTVLMSTYLYDDAGRLFSQTDPKAIVSANYYDLAGRTTKTVANYNASSSTITTTQNQTTAYGYNTAGQLATQTAVLPGSTSQVTEYVYGVSSADGSTIASNELVRTIKYPNPSTGAASTSSSGQESYTYDRLGRMLTKTDRNGTIHTYTYDTAGRQTSDKITYLASGVDGTVLRIDTGYDENGNASRFTSYSQVSLTQTEIDSGTYTVNEVLRVYNDLGQVTTEYQATSGKVDTSSTPKVLYAYSDLSKGSRLETVTYPNGRVLTYNYGTTGSADDRISRLTSITDGSTTLESYQYLGLSTIVSRAHGQPGVNLTYIGTGTGTAGDQYTGLDRFGRIVDQKWVSGSTAVDDTGYGYDRNGNRIYSQNLVNAAGFDNRYTYDSLNRLKSADKGTLNSTKTGLTENDGYGESSEAWTLDALGNTTKYTAYEYEGYTGGESARTYNKQNQMMTLGVAYAYDNNGNLLAETARGDADSDGDSDFNDFLALQTNFGMTGTTRAQGDFDGDGQTGVSDYNILNSGLDATSKTYTYDAWNRMVGLSNTANGVTTSATYAYDALGRRTKDNGTRLYYNTSWQVIEEYSVNGMPPTASYVWSPVYIDAMIARDRDTDANGTLDERLYALQDANWNVTALVNTSGNVVERFTYDAYGARQVLDSSWAATTDGYAWRQGFQGGFYDETLGNLMLFRNRMYDTATTRWMQQDPLGTAYQDGMNLYQFSYSNPIRWTDWTGLSSRIEPPSNAWGTDDFIEHFYTGGGAAVDLNNIGLLDTWTSDPYVRVGLDEARNRVDYRVKGSCQNKKQRITGSFVQSTSTLSGHTGMGRGRGWRNPVSGGISPLGGTTDPLYSLGGSLVTVRYDITVTTKCKCVDGVDEIESVSGVGVIEYQLNDRFENPLDKGGIHAKGGNLGGSPYDINAKWSEPIIINK